MANDPMEALNNAAFNSYDPDGDHFDPDGFDEFAAGSQIRTSPKGMKRGGPAPAAEFTITIAGTNLITHNVELFNAQNTIAEFANNTTNNGLVPVLAGRNQNLRNSANTGVAQYLGYGIIQHDSVGLTADQDVVYWDATGNLNYSFNLGGDTGNIQISCKEIPYRSLLKYAERGSFKVTRMRMRFTTAGQILNDFVHTQKTFLGKVLTNTISVQSAQSPDQFQSLIIDLSKPFRIDAEKGLQYKLNAGETVQIVMSIAEYVRSAI